MPHRLDVLWGKLTRACRQDSARAKPGDIPVEQPRKFDLIINLTTAKALGLTIPEAFLLRANEVLE
jgi:ABC transporter substrate binding protein